MRIQYGGYSFDADSVQLEPSIQSTFNSAGLPLTMKCTIQCSGALLGTDQNDIDAKITRFLAAFAVPSQDLLFFRTDEVLSAIRLRNRDSLSGVRITQGPSFPAKTKGEYSNHIDFTFQAQSEYIHPSLSVTGLAFAAPGGFYNVGGRVAGGSSTSAFAGGGGTEAEIQGVTGGQPAAIPGLGTTGTGGPFAALAGAGTGPNPLLPPGNSGGIAGRTTSGLYRTQLAVPAQNLVSGDLTSSLPGGLRPGVIPPGYLTNFHESVSIWGSGPLYGHLESINSPPQKQLLKAYTTCYASQEGTATGYADYPPIPLPLWPDCLVAMPKITAKEPVRDGFVYRDFVVSWAYQYQSASRLYGTPSWWPG